jgi:hypothetical protein
MDIGYKFKRAVEQYARNIVSKRKTSTSGEQSVLNRNSLDVGVVSPEIWWVVVTKSTRHMENFLGIHQLIIVDVHRDFLKIDHSKGCRCRFFHQQMSLTPSAFQLSYMPVNYGFFITLWSAPTPGPHSCML